MYIHPTTSSIISKNKVNKDYLTSVPQAMQICRTITRITTTVVFKKIKSQNRSKRKMIKNKIKKTT